MIVKKVRTAQKPIIVLFGDLSGFSFSFDKGNRFLVSQFIERFYYLVSELVTAAKGELIKFMGDGFLAVWPLKPDSNTPEIVNEVAHYLSVIVRLSKLGLNIQDTLILRQAIGVDNNAIRLRLVGKTSITTDYIGNVVNFCFRLQSLAKIHPYLVLHKDFLDLLDNTTSERYIPYDVTEEEKTSLFKGAQAELSKIYVPKQGFSESDLDKLISTAIQLRKQGLPREHIHISRILKSEFNIEHLDTPLHRNILGKRIHKAMLSQPLWFIDAWMQYFYHIHAMELEVYKTRKQVNELRAQVE